MVGRAEYIFFIPLSFLLSLLGETQERGDISIRRTIRERGFGFVFFLFFFSIDSLSFLSFIVCACRKKLGCRVISIGSPAGALEKFR